MGTGARKRRPPASSTRHESSEGEISPNPSSFSRNASARWTPPPCSRGFSSALPGPAKASTAIAARSSPRNRLARRLRKKGHGIAEPDGRDEQDEEHDEGAEHEGRHRQPVIIPEKKTRERC